MLIETKAGMTVADLPYTVLTKERENGPPIFFKVYPRVVLGTDQAGEKILGREIMDIASDDEIRMFVAFESVVGERDELAKQFAASASKKK